MFLHFFGISVSFLFFFISLFTLLPFLSIFLSFCLPFFLLPFLLCTPMAFYTACRDRIYYFYPLTAFGSLWVSFQNCPLVCQLLNHYHYTTEVAPRLIPKQKGFGFISYLS